MADEVDRQLERDEMLDAAKLKAVRTAASQIPVVQPGECELCGEWSGRLVRGVCAPCCDKYGLP